MLILAVQKTSESHQFHNTWPKQALEQAGRQDHCGGNKNHYLNPRGNACTFQQ
jgi:hypothetical protein